MIKFEYFKESISISLDENGIITTEELTLCLNNKAELDKLIGPIQTVTKDIK